MGRAFEYRKERKFKRWATMAKNFTRIGKEISIAVKEGGPNPETNSRLRAAIQNAKAVNMPKENIERAIKRATDKEMADYKEVVYEGYGPGGIAILIETATDNPTRTVANIRSYFNKHNGSLGTSGSVDFMFDHKCQFKIRKPENMDIEELELQLIDYGAEEFFEDEDDNTLMVYGHFSDYGKLQKGIEELGLEVISSGLERIPHETREVPDDVRAQVEKLLEKIEEDDDVQNVYHNMA
ncbi:putative transcriptional regulatory protein [Thermaurantimonas aggregans]|uniref:Probable transcriptional regulatory protein JCM31826_18360 n=1 Tax=Thermaurantimonas aggregans TaxID=2173829 RepID=A0A401XMW4_9FLAO|nr:YebC/PmpR family DNA-binding transcriptional regulator [Thermaurantimonas aggregans]MCX8148128.1 YebC/PmpR family DNA-binding transcriptional regulator [Thermaurantimonas aggregans]GCD78354.1 putative transcriptional regulatory protein [Thermaurantimonas aggregans]